MKTQQYLHGTGMACFVSISVNFANDTLSNAEIIEQIRKNEGYTKQAVRLEQVKPVASSKRGDLVTL